MGYWRPLVEIEAALFEYTNERYVGSDCCIIITIIIIIMHHHHHSTQDLRRLQGCLTEAHVQPKRRKESHIAITGSLQVSIGKKGKARKEKQEKKEREARKGKERKGKEREERKGKET